MSELRMLYLTDGDKERIIAIRLSLELAATIGCRTSVMTIVTGVLGNIRPDFACGCSNGKSSEIAFRLGRIGIGELFIDDKRLGKNQRVRVRNRCCV